MSAFARSFLDAFKQMDRVDDKGGADDLEYQSAVNALEGAKARARGGVDKCSLHSAIACLVAYEEAQRLLEENSLGTLNHDQTLAVILISETLRSLWRSFHKAGGQEAWHYAELIGASEEGDRRARNK